MPADVVESASSSECAWAGALPCGGGLRGKEMGTAQGFTDVKVYENK